MDTKVCPRCNETKPLSEFSVDHSAASGYKSHCKACVREASRRHRERMRVTEKHIPDSKVCAMCHVEKPHTDFNRTRLSTDGLSSYCKSCVHLHYEKQASRPKHEVTEKRCLRCGLTKPAADFYAARREPDGLQAWCIDCVKGHQAEVREHHKLYMREYRQQNKEQIQARHRRYYRDNQAYLLQAAKHYYRTEYKGTPGNRAAQKRANHLRRIRTLAAPMEWSPAMERMHWEKQEGCCARCGNPLTDTGRRLPSDVSIDHIVPLSLGGGLTFRNTQLLCFSCNSSKNDTVSDYRAWVPLDARVVSPQDLQQPSLFWDGLLLTE